MDELDFVARICCNPEGASLQGLCTVRYVRSQRVSGFLTVLVKNKLSILAILVSNGHGFCALDLNGVHFLRDAIFIDKCTCKYGRKVVEGLAIKYGCD